MNELKNRIEALKQKLSDNIENQYATTYEESEIAEVDNSVYRLANAIRKTQKRANALKNIVIPELEETIKFISESLEEKEREEFSRLKVIKANKEKQRMKEVAQQPL